MALGNVGSRGRQPFSSAREGRGAGVQGQQRKQAGVSLNFRWLLSHSPLALGVSFARSLPLRSLTLSKPGIKTTANFRGGLIVQRPLPVTGSIHPRCPSPRDPFPEATRSLHFIPQTMDKFWWHTAWGLCLLQLSLAQQQIGEWPAAAPEDSSWMPLG